MKKIILILMTIFSSINTIDGKNYPLYVMEVFKENYLNSSIRYCKVKENAILSKIIYDKYNNFFHLTSEVVITNQTKYKFIQYYYLSKLGYGCIVADKMNYYFVRENDIRYSSQRTERVTKIDSILFTYKNLQGDINEMLGYMKTRTSDSISLTDNTSIINDWHSLYIELRTIFIELSTHSNGNISKVANNVLFFDTLPKNPSSHDILKLGTTFIEISIDVLTDLKEIEYFTKPSSLERLSFISKHKIKQDETYIWIKAHEDILVDFQNLEQALKYEICYIPTQNVIFENANHVVLNRALFNGIAQIVYMLVNHRGQTCGYIIYSHEMNHFYFTSKNLLLETERNKYFGNIAEYLGINS